MTQVEVWNADETLLHRVSVRHAVRMIWRGVATPVEVHATAAFRPLPGADRRTAGALRRAEVALLAHPGRLLA